MYNGIIDPHTKLNFLPASLTHGRWSQVMRPHPLMTCDDRLFCDDSFPTKIGASSPLWGWKRKPQEFLWLWPSLALWWWLYQLFTQRKRCQAFCKNLGFCVQDIIAGNSNLWEIFFLISENTMSSSLNKTKKLFNFKIAVFGFHDICVAGWKACIIYIS